MIAHLSNAGLPPWLPLSVLVWTVQMLVYHGLGMGFELCDRWHLLRGAKVRDIDRLGYRDLLPQVLANQVFILLPAMVLLQLSGFAFVGTPHLTPLVFGLDLIVLAVGHDIVQYAAHRMLLHRPRLMRRLGHGLHHSTGASKAISACYMSAADFFLEIALPYLLPLALIGGGGDIFFHCIAVALGAIGGLYEHSGYDFAAPLLRSPIFAGTPRRRAFLLSFISSHAHAEHHRRSTVSFSDGFGSPGLCDTLFATRWDLAAETETGAAREPGPLSGLATPRPEPPISGSRLFE